MMLCAASSAGISRLHNWYFVLSMITYCPQNFTRQAGVYISNFYSPDDKFTRHWRVLILDTEVAPSLKARPTMLFTVNERS